MDPKQHQSNFKERLIMGDANLCHRCGTEIPRGHQVARTIGYCHNCHGLTDLAKGVAFTGKVELKLKPSYWRYMKITYLAKTRGQVAYMPNP